MTGQAPKRRTAGTVGVIGMDTGRFSEFSLALGRLQLPAGWEIMGALNYDEAHARNELVDRFIGDYLWFIDDDHGFPPDLLKRLLAYELPVVAPLVCQRRAPFQPVAIRDGRHLKLQHQLRPGPVEVDMTGTAGMLIRRDALDKLERPMFWHGDDHDGTHRPSDTNFCHKLREAGIPIHVDTSTTMTHFNIVGITPRRENGGWLTGFSVGNQEVFQLR